MKKKLVSVLLTGAMALSLVACGGKTEEVADTSAKDDAAQTEAADNGAAGSEDAIANLIAATEGTVDLTVWCSELPTWQGAMATIVDNFKAAYPEVDFNITIGAESESNCKDDILADPEVAADVFVFADDQLNDLVNAGALQSLDVTYTYDRNAAYTENALAAASIGDKLYAYPITASNGYFLYYDSTVFTAEDVQSWESLVAAAEAAGVKVGMEFSGAWYLYGFFAGAGLTCVDNGDGTNTCDWNSETGLAVAESVASICSSDAVVNINDGEGQTMVASDLKAWVNGTWNASVVQEAYGEGYAAVKLPTFNVNGVATQMGSFAGYKFVGVNSYSANKAWAMVLAEYITSEENQVMIGDATLEGMANAAAAAQQASPELAAIGSQSSFATLQRVTNNYWSPAATLGENIYAGTVTQADLDAAVEGIVAPVVEE